MPLVSLLFEPLVSMHESQYHDLYQASPEPVPSLNLIDMECL